MLETGRGSDEDGLMTSLIKPEDEAHVRLLVFGAALLAIATRGDVRDGGGTTKQIACHVEGEALAIADAVVAEAKRLDEQRKQTT